MYRCSMIFSGILASSNSAGSSMMSHLYALYCGVLGLSIRPPEISSKRVRATVFPTSALGLKDCDVSETGESVICVIGVELGIWLGDGAGCGVGELVELSSGPTVISCSGSGTGLDATAGDWVVLSIGDVDSCGVLVLLPGLVVISCVKARDGAEVASGELGPSVGLVAATGVDVVSGVRVGTSVGRRLGRRLGIGDLLTCISSSALGRGCKLDAGLEV